MAPPRDPERLIVFEPDGSYGQPSHVTIVEPNEGSLPLQPEELIQPSVSYIEAKNDQEQKQKYEGPLTLESILNEYSSIVPGKITDQLFESPLDSAEFETARLQAKSEITQKLLWRMGMPSELEGFLDIDKPETRKLLDEEYAQVLNSTSRNNRTTIRDNSPNSFYNRWHKIRGHIIQQSSGDKDIKQRLEDKMYVWREDLKVRIKMTEEGARPLSRAEQERQGHLDALLTDQNPSPDLIRRIGGTLLHENQEGRSSFFNKINGLTSTNPNRQRIISQLQAYVAKEFLPETELIET